MYRQSALKNNMNLSPKPRRTAVSPPPKAGAGAGGQQQHADDPAKISPKAPVMPEIIPRPSFAGIAPSATNNKMRREFSRENLLDANNHAGQRPPEFGPSKAALGLVQHSRRRHTSRRGSGSFLAKSTDTAAFGAGTGGGDPSPPVGTYRTEGERGGGSISVSGADGDGGDDCSEGELWSRPCPSWSLVGWDASLSDEDLACRIHGLMLRLLTDAVGREYASGERWEMLRDQMRSFVDRVSTLYRPEPRFHNWRHACHVVQAAEFLARKSVERDNGVAMGNNEEKEEGRRRTASSSSKEEQAPAIAPVADPWLPFVAAFCALIHDAKHLGVTNRHLESTDHLLCQMYDRGSCQEFRSLHVGLSVFAEEFPELSGEVLSCCPSFVRLVRSAVLATDISSADVQRSCRDKFDRALGVSTDDDNDEASSSSTSGNGGADAGAGPIGAGGGGGRQQQRQHHQSESQRLAEEERARTEATLEHILLLADVGHCSQGYDTFLRWNEAFYEECKVNYDTGRGDFDPRAGWYEGQIGFMENYIAPLAERCERLVPRDGPGRVELRGGVMEILKRWRAEGEEWTERMIEDHALDPVAGRRQAIGML